METIHKYRVTAELIDSILCSWEENEIYEAHSMKEAFDIAYNDFKNGEFKYEFVDIIKIELLGD